MRNGVGNGSMSRDVLMPRLSDAMEEGAILQWLKCDGDEVSVGDELVEIETDKANMVYESPQAGVLQIVAREGDTCPVGERIATIDHPTAVAPGATTAEPPVAVGADSPTDAAASEIGERKPSFLLSDQPTAGADHQD
jgi:pyruvate dehydrogenase E2 component (dihydrolipoamide acetyltransferase)